MILIVGLGNLPPKYAGTRHNVGWMVVDELANRLTERGDFSAKEQRLERIGTLAGQRVVLVKPTPFMNLSGPGVAAAAAYYKTELKDIYVVFDDVSVNLGRWRFRPAGSAGGHNGMESLLAHLGGGEFPRWRVGIGPVEEETDLSHFVLSAFLEAERKIIATVIVAVADDIEQVVRAGDVGASRSGA